MFTGIIQKMGRIERFTRGASGASLSLKTDPWPESWQTGESIAVDGVCLTLSGWVDSIIHFDLLNETMERTRFPTLQPGDPVNLERSLRVGDAMGGHFVTGHVDGTGVVQRFDAQDGDWILDVQTAPALLADMAIKGSITINGVSLTLVHVDTVGFRMHVIPHTREVTTLSGLKPGALVNIETDLLAKHVRRILGSRGAV